MASQKKNSAAWLIFVNKNVSFVLGVGLTATLVIFAFLLPRPRPMSRPVQNVQISPQQEKQLADTVSKQVSQAVADQAAPKASDYPYFESLPRMSRLTIWHSFITWTPDGGVEKATHAVLVTEGQFAKAYLFVRASTGAQPPRQPLTRWESIYMRFGGVGGHLFRPLSLKVPPDKNATTLLFDLHDIPYLPDTPYSEQRTPLHGEWFSPLVPGTHLLYVLISALQPSVLEDVSLYYECIEPAQCKITLK